MRQSEHADSPEVNSRATREAAQKVRFSSLRDQLGARFARRRAKHRMATPSYWLGSKGARHVRSVTMRREISRFSE
jgi:hypothetical protein